MSSTAALAWFARHEIRLAWREWLGLMTAGRRWRPRNVAMIMISFVGFVHLPAYWLMRDYAVLPTPMDTQTLIVLTACVALAFALMLSQAIESVTRVFYARADLDLIMSSPAVLTNVFSVRIAALAITLTAMALLLSAPLINALALAGGGQWLLAYGVVAACGLAAAALATLLTSVLFRLLGPARTRLVAQIVAAVIGAGFVIALQVAAVVSYGTLSRFAVLTSDSAAAFAPGPSHPLWWPARAMTGDAHAMLLLLSASLLLLGVSMAVVSPRVAVHVRHVAAQGSARAGTGRIRAFRAGSRRQALRRKEFLLLRRDPWLMSQTLMQLLYLVPPAVMLWHSFADSSAAIILVTPVIVMAAGQLAGGLAWLTISGEDAADFVATAPISAAAMLRAKIEVVALSIGAIFAPLVLPLFAFSTTQALVTASGVMLGALSATAIQLWFRVQARRSQFRRRQTSSRFATFAEAFSSIGWAATAALALVLPIAAAITGTLTLMLLALTWKLSPSQPA